jgi:DNA-binding NarL/FixJ family response regulator
VVHEIKIMNDPSDPGLSPAASWADVFAGIQEGNPLPGRLTPSEAAVAMQVRQGLSNREIALNLGKAEATVKHQVSACLRKFGVGTRTRLIALLR